MGDGSFVGCIISMVIISFFVFTDFNIFIPESISCFLNLVK